MMALRPGFSSSFFIIAHTINAATIDILIDKAHMEPRVAVAVAEAMDNAIDEQLGRKQWVTLPMLDSRVAELRTEIHGVKSDILRQMYMALLGQMAVLLGIAYFFVSQFRTG